MNSIIKQQSEPRSNLDAFVWALFLLYASRPSDAEPDETGRYFIGDCGDVPERTWTREQTYSPAQPK